MNKIICENGLRVLLLYGLSIMIASKWYGLSSLLNLLLELPIKLFHQGFFFSFQTFNCRSETIPLVGRMQAVSLVLSSGLGLCIFSGVTKLSPVTLHGPNRRPTMDCPCPRRLPPIHGSFSFFPIGRAGIPDCNSRVFLFPWRIRLLRGTSQP